MDLGEGFQDLEVKIGLFFGLPALTAISVELSTSVHTPSPTKILQRRNLRPTCATGHRP